MQTLGRAGAQNGVQMEFAAHCPPHPVFLTSTTHPPSLTAAPCCVADAVGPPLACRLIEARGIEHVGRVDVAHAAPGVPEVRQAGAAAESHVRRAGSQGRGSKSGLNRAHPQRKTPSCPHLLGRWEAGLFLRVITSLVPNTSMPRLPHSSTPALSLRRGGSPARPPRKSPSQRSHTSTLTCNPLGTGPAPR